MKKLFLTTLLYAPLYIIAQNVGIGTTTPSAKLEVKNTLRSTAKISSDNFTDTTELLLSNRNVSNEGTDFYIRSVREQGLFFSSQSDVAANNFNNSLVIRPNGNVGVAVASPGARFQVNHNSLFNTGIRLVDSGFVSAGVMQFQNASLTGGMTISGFASSNFSLNKSLSISSDSMMVLRIGGQGYVGIRDLSPDYPLDVNGDVNTTGRILINDNAGTPGQVLTSNGTADPSWSNSAYSNNVRFAFEINKNAAAPTGNARFASTHYNLSPTEVTVATDEITIARAGLYHLDFFLSGETTFAAAPANPPRLYFSFQCGFTPMLLVNSKVMDAASSTYFKMVESYSMNVYLPAGTVLRLFHSFSSSGTSYFVNGHLLGHLLSE